MPQLFCGAQVSSASKRRAFDTVAGTEVFCRFTRMLVEIKIQDRGLQRPTNVTLRLLLACGLLLLAYTAWAQPSLALGDVAPRWQLQYLDGPLRCDAASDPAAPAHSVSWRNIEPQAPVRRPKQLWLRLVSAEPIVLPDAWVASARQYGVPRLRYQFATGEPQVLTGKMLARSTPERPFEFATNALVVKLPRTLAAGESWNFCIARTGWVSSDLLTFQLESAFRAEDVRRAKFETACLAIMLAMVLSALFFAFTLRDPLYLWYVGHVVAFAFFQLRMTSEIFRWLDGWPLMPDLALRLSDLALGISVFCAVRFAMIFLDMPRHFPKTTVWLVRIAWAMLIASVLSAMPRAPTLENPLSLAAIYLPQLQNFLIAIVSVVVVTSAIRLSWRGSKAAHFYLASSLPLVLGGIFAALYAILVDASATFTPFLLPLAAFEAVVLSLGMADRALGLRQERDAARETAEHDALTGQLNRRGLMSRLEQAHTSLQIAPETSCALLYCDLDFLNRVNDDFGHEAGDQCLKHFAETIQTVLRGNKDRRRARQMDYLGRMGGEEFIVLLHQCSADHALKVAARICANLRETPVRWQTLEIALTVSIGVAMLQPDKTLDAAISAADAALYRAKREGRDRAFMAV